MFYDACADTIVWSADAVPVDIILEAAPDVFADARSFDPAAFGPALADRDDGECRHLVLGDIRGEHRLWIRDPAPGKPLAAVIPFDRDFAVRLASLLRFHRRVYGRDSGPPPRGWPLTGYRRIRLRRMLAALDMRIAGATYRAIAIELDDASVRHMTATEWKISRSRSYAVRLVRTATAMMNGGYRRLLRIR